METKVIEMDFEKETKNTCRFSEVNTAEGTAPVLNTLYVQKTALGNPRPEKIKVTIEAM